MKRVLFIITVLIIGAVVSGLVLAYTLQDDSLKVFTSRASFRSYYSDWQYNEQGYKLVADAIVESVKSSEKG